MKEFDLDFIKARRLALDFTLADMANKLGFSNPSVYYKYETGVYKFDADMVPVLAKALKCGVSKFFTHRSSKIEQEV